MVPGKQLIVVAVCVAMVQRIIALSCLPCHEYSCGPDPECSHGLTKDVCGCCNTCFKGPDESCGGYLGYHGKCASGLMCESLSCNQYTCRREVSTCVESVNRRVFWLGGSDFSEEGKWKWVNGQPIEKMQYPWRWPEPDGDEKENCLEWNGYWFNDVPCNKHLRYICELENNEDPASVLPTMSKFENKYNEHQSGTIWAYSKCSYIDYVHNSSSLSECMNSCNTNNHCTAGSYNIAERGCTLDSCPLPIPQPRVFKPGYISYSLRDVEVYDNGYCYSQGGTLIGRKCLIISDEFDYLNWDKASKACISKGGQLASLQGFRELQLVRNFIYSMN